MTKHDFIKKFYYRKFKNVNDMLNSNGQVVEICPQTIRGSSKRCGNE